MAWEGNELNADRERDDRQRDEDVSRLRRHAPGPDKAGDADARGGGEGRQVGPGIDRAERQRREDDDERNNRAHRGIRRCSPDARLPCTISS